MVPKQRRPDRYYEFAAPVSINPTYGAGIPASVKAFVRTKESARRFPWETSRGWCGMQVLDESENIALLLQNAFQRGIEVLHIRHAE